ncbi:uncharacterized protein [Watersipora subatra]|uniref:uncharacterized protein n=1 Tax=Watersipora subatra TaxID=2589382 RepID=UPI00355BA630
MSLKEKSVEYGNFDIVWRGALRALLEEEDSADEIAKISFSSLSEEPEIPSQSNVSSQRVLDTEDSFSEDSPVKPIRNKRLARIDSDSDTSDSLFDSDLEIIDEQWRPVDRDASCGIHDVIDSLDEPDSDLTKPDQPATMFKLPKTSAVVAAKTNIELDLKFYQFRRPGLRSRSKQNRTTQMKLSQRVADLSKGCNSRESSRTSSTRERRRIGIPISIEEELIGEDIICSSDEEYEQRLSGGLIEREAQCSDEEEDDSDVDGELEQSFINDQTIMSQQLSQDTMHGVYLQSLRRPW